MSDSTRKDVLIIKRHEDSYYVSEKTADSTIYYSLLINCLKTSDRYPSLDSAKIAANQMKAEILPFHPKCRIIGVDIAKFTKSFDIMIVRCDKDDYFVSAKNSGWSVSNSFFKSCSYTSNHYSSLELARTAAEELRQSVLSENADCKIEEYDIKCCQNPAWEKLKMVRMVYDDKGRILFGLTKSGKKKFVFREGEEKYEYIDVPEYYSRIMNESLPYKNSTEFDYYNLGICQGFDVARGKNIPRLYYEIYKAEKMIESFADDPELFDCDIRFYSGYIETIEKAISIQKEYAVSPGEWYLHLLNLQDTPLPDWPETEFVDNLGRYTLLTYSSPEEFVSAAYGNDIYLIVVPPKTDMIKLRAQLSLPDGRHILFINTPLSARKKAKYRKQSYLAGQIKSYFSPAGKYGGGLAIPEEWVEGLEQFASSDSEE